MATTVAVREEYARLLEPLGNLEEAVETALRRYAIERIVEKIAELRRRERKWQAKYGCDYDTFVRRTASDEEFVCHIEQTISKTWELDLAEWEFCHQGVRDWSQHLQALLLE